MGLAFDSEWKYPSNMSHTIKPLEPADPQRVNIYDSSELHEFWAGYFEAAPQSIVDAVMEVGDQPDAVYKKLGKSHD